MITNFTDQSSKFNELVAEIQKLMAKYNCMEISPISEESCLFKFEDGGVEDFGKITQNEIY